LHWLCTPRAAAHAATLQGWRDVNIAVIGIWEMDTDRANGLLSEAQYQATKLELEARLADDALTVDNSPEPARVGSRRLGFALGTLLPAAAFGLYFWLGNPPRLRMP
jgi:cytochrome c-type biogenesis protein CcmI